MVWSALFIVLCCASVVTTVVWIKHSKSEGAQPAFIFTIMFTVCSLLPVACPYMVAPANGVHKVTEVWLPRYADQVQDGVRLKLESAGSYDKTLVSFPIDSVPGFNHCCVREKVDCGCIEVRKYFWAGKVTAKAVPCPGHAFKLYQGCPPPPK